jgi:hypothetical protein
MKNRSGGRGRRRSLGTVAILMVATLAAARTAQAQLGSQLVDPGASHDARCNSTVLRCDTAFASALPWSTRDILDAPGLHARQATERSTSHWLIGAIGGFVVGATATYFVLHSGGSTSKCDRDANQDALNRGECAGLIALGGLVGAGAGALIGSRFRSDAVRLGSVRGLEIGRMTNGRISVAGRWVH